MSDVVERLRAERDEARRVELAVHQILDRTGFTEETTEAKADRLVGELVTVEAERDRLRDALRRVTVAACESEAGRTEEHHAAIDEALVILAALKGDTQ